MDWRLNNQHGLNSGNDYFYGYAESRGQRGHSRGNSRGHSRGHYSHNNFYEGYHSGNIWRGGGQGDNFHQGNLIQIFASDVPDVKGKLEKPSRSFDPDVSDVREMLEKPLRSFDRGVSEAGEKLGIPSFKEVKKLIKAPPGKRGRRAIGNWYAQRGIRRRSKAAKRAPLLSMNANDALAFDERINNLSMPGASSHETADSLNAKWEFRDQKGGSAMVKGRDEIQNDANNDGSSLPMSFFSNKLGVSTEEYGDDGGADTGGCAEEKADFDSSSGLPTSFFSAKLSFDNSSSSNNKRNNNTNIGNSEKRSKSERGGGKGEDGGVGENKKIDDENIQNSKFNRAYKANIKGNKLTDMGINKFKNEFSMESKRNPELDTKYFAELKEKEINPRYQEMLNFRKRLPCYDKRQEIVKLIRENQVVVLSGETGCGKTTQIPQYLLDDIIREHNGSTCHIICTQPRRISTITVAERVAQERAEQLGQSVGYHIRLESVLPRNQGSILYCTTGIILQWLQSDSLLSSVSHLILDEIHERDLFSDFLICITRDLLPVRPDLKVVLMSATLNAEKFSEYFNNCPMIHIPGFTFDVQEYYLEDVLQLTRFKFQPDLEAPISKRHKGKLKKKEIFDTHILSYTRRLKSKGTYPLNVIKELSNRNSEELNIDLILSLLMHIASTKPPGAILVFLPGWEQITKLDGKLRNDPFFDGGRYLIVPLHSMMPTINQKEIFNRPPEGVRKIILATNIAETSITIDDVVYVIDSGYIKRKNFDIKSESSTLLPEFVTLANARQRRGRAGRVQEGICYHLFSKGRAELLDEFPLPEIRRTRMEELILQLKLLQLGSCKPFLKKVLDPPEDEVINVSLKMLEVIRALDAKEVLTPLGFHLARLPLDPLTGKMILMGSIFSCLSPVLTVAASLSFKDPFAIPLGKEKAVDECRYKWSLGTKSDHLMMVHIFDEWQSEGGEFAYHFMRENYLSGGILTQLRGLRIQFMKVLKYSQLVNTIDPDDPDVNINSSNIALVKAVITAGLYPNVAQIVKKNGGPRKGMLSSVVLPGMRKVTIHHKSVNANEQSYVHPWFVYWEKIKTKKMYLYDTTEISNYPLVLFGQKFEYKKKDWIIEVDDFIKIQCEEQIATVIKKLRVKLDELLEYKTSHPGPSDWSDNSKEGRLLSLIVDFISNEEGTSDQIQNDNVDGDVASSDDDDDD